jgi:hypothetical protein
MGRIPRGIPTPVLLQRVRNNMIAKGLSNALVQKSAQEIEKKEVHVCTFGEVVREGCRR